MAPAKPQPPRPGSSSQLPKVVVVEESASPPQGEPRAVPHRERQPSVPGELSPRVQGDGGSSARSVGDDPVAVRRQQDAERDALIGRLLAQVSELTDKLDDVQRSVPPPPPKEETPTPAAWKTAMFKLVVGMAAAAGAAATLFQIVSATLEPQIKQIKADKGTEELADYYTAIQRYEYDAKLKYLSECRWKHSSRGFRMLLPAPDKMGAELKIEPFLADEVCPDWPTMPDKPKQPSAPPKKD